ncbi:hypothetical protein FA13DRAFT_1718628 [Coprinellus micaceus]|uniref:Uncharacterized protein n=1 Tax=Coprinellus micaceus TaxID=71717 RepID=A0A4Y7SDP7_COPMI|nr:hypothetical protein FA13DRAFT_1718628 [Coprinellus micaceus]
MCRRPSAHQTVECDSREEPLSERAVNDSSLYFEHGGGDDGFWVTEPSKLRNQLGERLDPAYWQNGRWRGVFRLGSGLTRVRSADRAEHSRVLADNEELQEVCMDVGPAGVRNDWAGNDVLDHGEGAYRNPDADFHCSEGHEAEVTVYRRIVVEVQELAELGATNKECANDHRLTQNYLEHRNADFN